MHIHHAVLRALIAVSVLAAPACKSATNPSAANAGVVLPLSAPVFLRSNGGLATTDASKIRVGDQIQVWRDPIRVAYGAVQGPPGAPTYTGTQIVIVR